MAKTKDMTTGSPWKLIFVFALPLMMGNVFQQLYTVVDTLIVGQGIGVQALAALGAADWTYWMIGGMISGVTQGFSIMYAQQFGAGNIKELRRNVGTSAGLALAVSVMIVITMQILVIPLLRLLQTPEDILPMSVQYLRIMFAGAPIVMFYNLLASILRSLGDGRTPLFAMIVACIVNIVLDLLFVMGFRWGIAGAAAATLIAQACSAVFCLQQIRKIDVLAMETDDWKFRPGYGAKLLRLGTPLAFQQIVICVGGMIVQMIVNGFGVLFIAGFTATNKLYGILEIAATSFGYAIMTYTGQNIGAGNVSRIRKGVRQGAVMAVLTSVVIAAVMLIFGKHIVGLFINGTPEEIVEATKVAWEYLIMMASFLPVLYILYVYRAALQGLGDTFIPMMSGVVELFMRVGAVAFLPRFWGSFGVFAAEPAAWFGAAVLLFGAYVIRMQRMKG